MLPRLLLVALAALPLAMPCTGAAALRPPEEAEPAVAVPATSAGKQLRWVLRALSGENEGETAADVAGHFTDLFLESITAEDVIGELTSIRNEVFKQKKVRAVMVNEGERDDTLTAVIAAKSLKRYLSVFIIVDDKTGKIAGLRFEPAGGEGGGETPTRGGSWDEMDAAMEEMGDDEVMALVASVVAGGFPSPAPSE